LYLSKISGKIKKYKIGRKNRNNKYKIDIVLNVRIFNKLFSSAIKILDKIETIKVISKKCREGPRKVFITGNL
jgi:hypothetical protein